MTTIQGVYWIATVSNQMALEVGWNPRDLFEKHDNVIWVYGQEEEGQGGFLHYQFIFSLEKKARLGAVRKLFPSGLNPHLELTKSKHAEEYCRKHDTKVFGSEFEHGAKVWLIYDI